MSQESVEATRRSFELWLQGDLAGWLETIDPEFRWDISTHPLPDVPNKGQGRDAVIEAFVKTYLSGWNDYQAKVREIVDVGGDQVLVVLHETARMRETDALIDRDLIFLWTVPSGRGTFMRVFRTKDEALEAAGLSEQQNV